jgi:hypothetical protein
MGNPHPTSVQVEIALHLVVPDGQALPVQASLRYEPSDPYAVHVVFHAGTHDADAEVSWSFGRQLLVDGMSEPTGIGDVRAWPWLAEDGPVIALALTSPDGHALLHIPQAALRDFLTRTFTQVPLGQESSHLDMDQALAELLGIQGSGPR